MDTSTLKKFAQAARRQLREQVAGRLEQVLRTDSAELRQKETAVRELRREIEGSSQKAVIDRVAYTWFNRFCALRFMDVNRYTRMGVVSPAEGFTQPEILQEAKAGHIDEGLRSFVNSQEVLDLLSGKTPSSDPQQEAYRLLLVGVCNCYNEIMPFLFERIADYTELLMPADLLSENSILHALCEALTADACKDVEVIGWLYQYYISERKDEVFEALKKNQKIEAADIPAATQLFTPHWIVRYLVENSLGRLWLLNHPNSRLAEKMEYYIHPVEAETDFLKISSAEEIKLCDPACGSGHMLTYAFDLLYAIYEEEGYPVAEIPALILEKNLYGIEIDERAGGLAAFALFMKGRGSDKRFFARPTQPNVCVLENITFSDQELAEYMKAVGPDLFSEPLLRTLKQFEQAKNFGSLIQPVMTDIAYIRKLLDEKNLGGDLLLYNTHRRVLNALVQVEYLSQRYHVVVANPPYMGSSGMNDDLKEFINTQYPISKAELGPVFLNRNFEFVFTHGLIGMITMQSWMFLSSFEELREEVINRKTILSMAHFGARAFDSIGGEVVSTTSFVILNGFISGVKSDYIRLVDKSSEKEKARAMQKAIFDSDCGSFFRASADDFKKIPGWPIAYWVSDRIRISFKNLTKLSDITTMRKGLATSDNDRFIRQWFEVNRRACHFGCQSREESILSGKKWYPLNKGGSYRKWYGNNEYVINWQNDGYEIRNFFDDYGQLRSRPQNLDLSFKQALTWSKISSGRFSARYCSGNFLFDDAGAICHSDDEKKLKIILPILCSNIGNYYLQIINCTLNFQIGDVSRIPIIIPKDDENIRIIDLVNSCIEKSQTDWNAYEISWNFSSLPILQKEFYQPLIKMAYELLNKNWLEITSSLRKTEEEINSSFIELYGFQSEMASEIAAYDITLTCNPLYRYGSKKDEEEYRQLLLADTMKEYISYAAGCMLGRYSLDKPGLILANQGETLQDYQRLIPQPSFRPAEDNVLPILDGDWFPEDINERFKKFLRLTFGGEHYEENLAFIEEAIGRDIRSYFLKEFYDYHVRMYKKRPIYWLFSSPGGSFNALIYMHRYQPDTVSVVLNSYLRPYIQKLSAFKAHQEQVSIAPGAGQAEKTKALKEITRLNKVLAELKEYESEVLYPLATQRIVIDLDDGVKVNYPRFGKALRKISGLSEA